jgi:hypothetical protein
MLEMLMHAWIEQRAKDQADIEQAFYAMDPLSHGVYCASAFRAVLRSVDAATAKLLPDRQVNTLFREAMRRDGGNGVVHANAFAEVLHWTQTLIDT